eukprot:2267453-Lingulodinium_polyedra.AAC.1
MGQRGCRRSRQARLPAPALRRGGATFIDEQRRHTIGVEAKWVKGFKPWMDFLLGVVNKCSGPWKT